MQKSLGIATLAATIMLSSSLSHADTVCPKGSLSGMVPASVWEQYATRNADHVKRLLRRLSDHLARIQNARGIQAQMTAASRLGRDNAMVIERMFSEGFIAATDIINAHCVSAPDREPWNEELGQQRRRHWCEQWGDAHFCPKR